MYSWQLHVGTTNNQDDVAFFIRPEQTELHLTRNLLANFWWCLGITYQSTKELCDPYPLWRWNCGGVNSTLQSTTSNFPTTYLGLPISDKKLRRGDLLPWIEKIANKLPGWKVYLVVRFWYALYSLPYLFICWWLLKFLIGSYKQLIRSGEVFYRKEGRKLRGAVV